MDFGCSDLSVWKESLCAYQSRIQSLSLNKNKPDLVSLDDFYCNQLPSLLHQRNPNPFITTVELSKLMQWKLTRGKWRPRLLDFVSSLDDAVVKSASQEAFLSLPDISKAVTELTVLKGVGPATASAVLAAFTPHLTPFMSDEAMEAALGNSKDYSLKQYLNFADKLQMKAKVVVAPIVAVMWYCGYRDSKDLGIATTLQTELSSEGDPFTPSDVERALWSFAVGQSSAPQADQDPKTKPSRSSKRKRKN